MDYSKFFKEMLTQIELGSEFNPRDIVKGQPLPPELSSDHAIKQHMENILFELKQTSLKSADDEKIRTLNEYLGMPKLPFDV